MSPLSRSEKDERLLWKFQIIVCHLNNFKILSVITVFSISHNRKPTLTVLLHFRPSSFMGISLAAQLDTRTSVVKWQCLKVKWENWSLLLGIICFPAQRTSLVYKNSQLTRKGHKRTIDSSQCSLINNGEKICYRLRWL